MTPATDTLHRRIRDLRVSVTDRCNFRCTYCMPKEVFNADYRFMARAELLSFEEIVRAVALFADLGVEKVRLTGGEPLIRRHLEVLIEKTARLGAVSDLSLTTNGALLTEAKARALRDAGLSRLTVSLDALDDAVFSRLNGVSFPVGRVLQGIDNGLAAGFAPIKINMVVRRGVNDAQVLPMARRFRGGGVILRFIEYMDVGHSNGWRMNDVVPSAELVRTVGAEFPIEPLDANYRGEVATRWRYRDGAGEIGFISSVTQPFCGGCTRVRMSADGQLYTCLFAVRGHDFRKLLRERRSDEFLKSRLRAWWESRDDRYSELRGENTAPRAKVAPLEKVEMSYIGG